MTTFKTMTVGGIYGPDVEAEDVDEAENTAEHMGMEVLDVVERTDGLVLVIAGEGTVGW